MSPTSPFQAWLPQSLPQLSRWQCLWNQPHTNPRAWQQSLTTMSYPYIDIYLNIRYVRWDATPLPNAHGSGEAVGWGPGLRGSPPVAGKQNGVSGCYRHGEAQCLPLDPSGWDLRHKCLEGKAGWVILEHTEVGKWNNINLKCGGIQTLLLWHPTLLQAGSCRAERNRPELRPDVVVGTTAPWQGVGTRWSLRSLPNTAMTLFVLWFIRGTMCVSFSHWC